LRLWMHSRAAKAHMKTAFPLYEKWGIEGVMVDFFEHDDQETVNFVRQLVALAARHHLTVTLHNIYKPTGLERTYPNLLSVEGVLNAEWNKWGDQNSRGSTPKHQLTVPFTRMLAGPMDFHSGGFRSVRPAEFRPRNVAPMVMGTRCHQLALYVVYENYLPMVADYPAAYRKQPGLDFLVQVPTFWDETRVLNAAVGEFITVARRRGKAWYVGTMAAGGARELSISLKFLGPGKYTAEVWADDRDALDQPSKLVFRQSEVTSADTIKAALAPSGGHILRLTPAR
jgi:alpha-glucosidase